MTLRVCVVGPLPPPAGGMANLTLQLVALLRAEGMLVELVQTNAPYHPRLIENVRGLRAGFRLLPYLARLWQAAGRADVMHVMANSGWSWRLFAAPAIRIARLRRVPVLVNYHGGEAADFLTAAGASVRRTLGGAQVLAVPSSYLREVFHRNGLRTRTVPNVVDLERFRFRPPRPPSDSPVIAVTRNLEQIYGVDVAITAFAEIRKHIPSARLDIAGTGPELGRLQHLVARLHLQEGVRFLGRLDPQAVAALLVNADVVLNASRADNTPGALLEALAAGVPVVSSNAGGIPHLVRHGETALLCPVDDAPALAAAVLSVLGDPGLAERLIKKGVFEVEQYKWARVKPLLLDAYRDCMRLEHAGRSEIVHGELA